MLWAVFLVFIALGSSALAIDDQSNATKPLKPKNKNCWGNVQVEEAKKNYAQCFQTQLSRKGDRCKHDEIYEEFVKTVEKSCEKKPDREVNFIENPYLDLVRFSMSIDLTEDFVKDGPVCIKKEQEKITNCVEKSNAQAKNKQLGNETERLWRKSMLTFTPKACSEAKSINICVMSAISSCHENVRKYVQSIYDHVQSSCDLMDDLSKLREEVRNGTENSTAAPSTADRLVITQTSSPLLTALLVLLVLAILYVLIRDFKHRMLPFMPRRATREETCQMNTLNSRP